MFSNIKAVRVQEVIMSGSARVIGNIKFSEIDDGKPLSTRQLPFARPLFNNFSQYPTVNEIVYVLGGPDVNYNTTGGFGNYYLPPLNINGSPNHNAQPNELFSEELEAGVETSLDYFKEMSMTIRPLLPYLGDIMLEGRYGNSIRFGSTISGSHVPNNWSNEGSQGHPITIIRNGQTNDPQKAGYEHILEDINEDDTSIYLCSNQQITNFQKAGTYPKDHPASYKHML
jgi:hypothetical protein